MTLADVARLASVSPVTASRALGSSVVVAQSTRDRVVAAAAKLNYSPNLLARGLVHNCTSTIGVMVHELANPFVAPIVSQIEQVAAERDYLVVVGESGRSEVKQHRYVERFQQLRIGGIIVHPATGDLGLLELGAKGTPVVILARRWEKGDYVTVDNLEGGRLAARHLLSRGHRRVGLVRSRDPENTALQERAHGFREVLASGGVSLTAASDLVTDTTSLEDGFEAAGQWLRLSERPTAVFAVTDRMAMGMIHCLLGHGVRVPEDIAVVGFDDIPFAEYAEVPLTTVAIPIRQIGKLSAEILFERLDSPDLQEHRHIVLATSLVVRASSP